MVHAPIEGVKLHDGDEPGQVQHLTVHVLAIAHAVQVEELGSCRPP